MWQRWHQAGRLAGLLSAVSWFRWPVASTTRVVRISPSTSAAPTSTLDEPAGSVAPGGRLLVPPPPVAQVDHRSPVRAPAALAPPLSATEADHTLDYAGGLMPPEVARAVRLAQRARSMTQEAGARQIGISRP